MPVDSGGEMVTPWSRLPPRVPTSRRWNSAAESPRWNCTLFRAIVRAPRIIAESSIGGLYGRMAETQG